MDRPRSHGLIPFSVVLGVLGLVLIGVVTVYVLSRSASGGIPVAGEVRVAGGDAGNGPALLRDYGCVTCHRIDALKEATGAVGPELTRFPRRAVIAGRLQNTPANLIRWVRFPQQVSPGTAMPNLGVTESHARDIAAYLYSLDGQ